LQPFTTLKIEGGNAKDVAKARRALDETLSGVILTDSDTAIWSPALRSNGTAYQKLRSIEKDLDVVITR
jgi:hypothetical protein